MWPETESMHDISINKGQVLVDIVYNPLETKWLISGKKNGASIVGGLDMFIFQGMASLDIWFNKKISENIELEPIKKVLKSELC
jgi:shikimate dehydrogenase